MSLDYLKTVEESQQVVPLSALNLVYALKNGESYSSASIIQDASISLEKHKGRMNTDLRIVDSLLSFVRRMLIADYDSPAQLAEVEKLSALSNIASIDTSLATARRKAAEADDNKKLVAQENNIRRLSAEREAWSTQYDNACATIATAEQEA